jgi:uncharacterized protein
MKYLVLVAILAVVVGLMLGFKRKLPGRAEKPAQTPPQQRKKSQPTEKTPQAMLACAHCGLHLPQADASFDVAQRPYCSDAHRLAGPR